MARTPRPGQARRDRRRQGRIDTQSKRPTGKEKRTARRAKRKKKAIGGVVMPVAKPN